MPTRTKKRKMAPIDYREFIESFYSRRLSGSELAERQAERIERRRERHRIAERLGESLPPSRANGEFLAANDHYSDDSPTNLSCLGAPRIGELGWIEDLRCPFCPPYNLALTASLSEIEGSLSRSIYREKG